MQTKITRPAKATFRFAQGILLLAFASAGPAVAEENKSATADGRVASSATNQFDPPLGVTGTIRKHDGFSSKLVAARNVHVWLPPSYEKETMRRYAVIYAMDGQNQFDPKLSFIGVDWTLDETMTRLIAEKKVREAIVVAVWNTPKRAPEYVPQKALLSAIGTPGEATLRDGAKRIGFDLDKEDWRLSDAYLKFLVQELKPFVDREYRTATNRNDTFIMGSSAGAMISLYAISEYPDVFGGAACLSAHWPLGDGILVEYFKDKLPDPATHKIYFDFGTATLDHNYEPYQVKMDAAMEKRGYRRDTNWLTRKFEGDEHSEKAWRKRVHIPLEFLLGRPD